MSANLLGRETSPYLLQHRDNPVAWRPWGPEAFAEAQKLDRPILLSIGYASCHWCHVMAHESFEDAATAALMNELFVNIKVDREERPDIDRHYMEALLAFGRRGGWPLTLFLTPKGEPFWGGTYFPPEPRFGQPGFKDVLTQIAQAYRESPDKIRQNAESIASRLERQPAPKAAISLATLDDAADRLLAAMDERNGGLKGAPKFPQASLLEFLWRAGRRRRDARFDEATLLTLRRIGMGGVYDHLGGGFARYATDEKWLVPHFEKMLYDNAQLIHLLTWAWQKTHDAFFRHRIEQTVDWLEREMRTADAYSSSLDADSDGGEGRYYVWRWSDIMDALGADDGAFFAAAYGAMENGNWEGVNVLNRLDGAVLSAAQEDRLARLRSRLLEARSTRVRPALDDKILADWNGMTIRALAFAGAVLARPEWIGAAERAYRWIMRNMREGDRFVHSSRLGRRGAPGLASDGAHMCAAALALCEATGHWSYVADAQSIVRMMDEHYWDAAKGYCLSASDSREPFARSADAQDDAVPASNGVMAANLVRLGLITGDGQWLRRAERLFDIFGGEATHRPFDRLSLLSAFDLATNATQVVVIGEADGQEDLAFAALQRFEPNLIVVPVQSAQALAREHPAYGRSAISGRQTAFVCRQSSCSLPVASRAELEKILD